MLYILEDLNDQLLDASDSDEEDWIEEDIELAGMMLEELVFEKVDDLDYEWEPMKIDITIDSLDVKDVANHYRFRTKARLGEKSL